MAGIFGAWIGGALPIIFIAWLARKATRSKLTPTSALASVVFAAVVTLFLQGFGEGEGGFWPRVDHMLKFGEAVMVWPASLLALAVVLFFGWKSDRPRP